MLLSKEFTFDCAHSLINYNGKCNYLHGHTYKLKVYIKGFPNLDPDSQEFGMIIDFENIKKIIKSEIIDKFDHSFIVAKNNNKDSLSINNNQTINIKYSYLEYPFNIKTTCEMISLQILNDLKKKNVPIYAIELYETPTSFCYVTIDDLKKYLIHFSDYINKRKN